MSQNRLGMLLIALAGTVLVLVGWACTSYDAAQDAGARAARHMATADSLERAGDLRTAMLEYSLVVQHYPQSTAYGPAVHHSALLALDPRNPASSDSTALYWLDVYLRIPGEAPAADDARIEIALLQHVAVLRSALARARNETDSLMQLFRKQGSSVAAQSQRIQEAELQLKQAQQELARLKQVDVQLSRTRRRP